MGNFRCISCLLAYPISFCCCCGYTKASFFANVLTRIEFCFQTIKQPAFQFHSLRIATPQSENFNFFSKVPWHCFGYVLTEAVRLVSCFNQETACDTWFLNYRRRLRPRDHFHHHLYLKYTGLHSLLITVDFQ